MKRSHFACCVALDGADHALLNTATGAFALCDDVYARAFESASLSDSGDLEATVDESASSRVGVADLAPLADDVTSAGRSEAFDELATAGFLVDDELDEISLLQQKFISARTDRSQLFLSIAPTYACNCRCSYCYEQDKIVAKAPMGDEVEQAIYAFVEERWTDIGFTSLFVEWYGGDPQLCLGLVERMSRRLIAFCEERSLEYGALMLSNSTRIREREARLIADARISSMLITIDGPEDLHNARRPAIDVDNAYQAILEAIGHLQAEGVVVNAAMNADRVNMARFPELRDALRALGVEVSPTLLNDYAHTFDRPGECRFCKPGFDLYDHEEFAHARYGQMRDEGFTLSQMRALFTPFGRFCSGQLDASYVIDALGDVYKCDGWMGDKSRAVFNILDVPARQDAANHQLVTFDPFADPKCRACKLLPLCMGNCTWERELTDWPCHPFAYTLKRYLGSYRDCVPPREHPFELVTPPIE